MMMNSNSTTSKSQKKSTLIFWIESNSTYIGIAQKGGGEVDIFFSGSFIGSPFCYHNKVIVWKKWLTFGHMTRPQTSPFHLLFLLCPILPFQPWKRSKTLVCGPFFFTWEWIINTTIMALTTIHNLVYKQLLWSIFPPQNASGSLTSFFWTTCSFGFGNILNTYLKSTIMLPRWR